MNFVISVALRVADVAYRTVKFNTIYFSSDFRHRHLMVWFFEDDLFTFIILFAETMSAKNPEGIEIPSVFVSDLAGLLLGDEYLYTSG